MDLKKVGARAICLLAASLLLVPQVWAQNPTGTLTGRVSDESGGGLPGVTVTATSPALQGERATTTSANGDYKLAFLPPGNYQVSYQLEGFKASVRDVKISAAQTTPSNIRMELGEVSEEIIVTGQQATISETVTGAATVTQDELESLPIQRNLTQAVNLAPGVADTGVSSAPSIAGAPSFENLFLINGVVINENLRGSILDLFIEDAIQETTTSVSGISAQYGRFTGGVVNAITKSGGNQFDGSLRVNLTNEDWEARTPLSSERVDDISESFEGTLGGYILKDHLWFFGAGRDRSITGSNQTDITNIQYPTGDEETRTEGKLTISPHPSHSIIGSYLEIDRSRINTDFGVILDERSLNANRSDPQEIKSLNYTGILSDNFFVEGQFSERDFIIGSGAGGVPDLIEGTLIRTRGESFRYWSPTFCGSCEDEERNNKNLLFKGSYFLSTDNAGTHDLTFGYDTFEDIRFAINHQTGSDFTVYASDIVRNSAGDIVLDAGTGSPFPVFDPDAASTPWIRWFAVFNEDLATPTSFNTNSFYVNDSWQYNDKWSFNVGFRWDENDGQDSAGATVADDSKVSPRFGATYDIRGDGSLVLNAAYGTYVAALANSVADDASPGGAIGSLRYEYGGPPINVGCTPGVNCLDSRQVLNAVFAWYESQGGVFDLNQLDPNAPITNFQNQNSVPGATTQVQGGIESPSVDEFTVGLTKRLGNKGLIRADVVYREWEDFYGELTDLSTGQVDTSTGPADVTFIGNFNDGITREYLGLHTSFRYRFSDRFTLAGNYTLSNTEGNFVGETTGSGPVSATALSYPQYREERWNYPTGDLRVDQRHKVRVWGVYKILDTARHKLNVSWLENYFSGQPYAANNTIDPRDFVTNPGFADPPSAISYFFSARDAFRTDDIHRSDLSLNYSFNLNAWGRNIEIFLQPEILNIFNEDGVIDPAGLDDDESVTVLQDFDPFTTTPVEGVDFELSSNFGQPLNENDFQTPRTFRFSVGFRF